MREIKFRAWDKRFKKMVYDRPVAILFLNDSDHEIMEYTGLNGKDGIEIYEGDILQIETEDHKIINVVCEYGIARRVMDTGWEVDIPSFYFKRNDGLLSFPIVKNWQGKHDLEIIEVIGNIYENPELIS